MRHRVAGKKLNRNTAHRRAMARNFICSVITHERVQTTVPKAKALRPALEKVITLGKKRDLHRFRRALSMLQDETVVRKLFEVIGPRYASRSGGYTRIVRLPGHRIGDGGSKAILELVDNDVLEKQLEKASAESPVES